MSWMTYVDPKKSAELALRMPGFEVVQGMEGGTYLVGWPK